MSLVQKWPSVQKYPLVQKYLRAKVTLVQKWPVPSFKDMQVSLHFVTKKYFSISNFNELLELRMKLFSWTKKASLNTFQIEF